MRYNDFRIMIAKLTLLFTLVPLVEIFILVKLGGLVGALPTVLLVILTGVAGAYLVRRQGIKVAGKIRKKLQSGRMPAEELWEGAALLVAGTTMITPGLITDFLGFVLLVPFARSILKEYVLSWARKRWLENDETYVDIEN